MPQLKRVLLVGPRPAYTWKSITNYTESIAGVSALDGVEIESQEASWWAPPVARQILDRRRGKFGVSRELARGFDVVHVTDQGLGHHVSSAGSTPTVVTCHDVMPFVVPDFSANAVSGMLQRELLRPCIRGMRKATRIVAVSRATADDLSLRFGVDESIVDIVPVPINAAFRPMGDARRLLEEAGVALPHGLIVLSVGAVSRSKNLDLLIGALAGGEARGLSLVRVGPPLPDAQRRLGERLGIAERVVELGNVPLEILVGLYNACHVLAQPSVYEGFGMPVAEAMSCGLPVVCSDGGALPEVAGGAAMVVPLGPPGDADALQAWSSALAEGAAESTVRLRLREAGLLRARAFEPETVARQLFDVYRAAIGAN